MPEEAFIYDSIRTPRGKQRGGNLNKVKPVDLIISLIEEIKIRHPNLDKSAISDVILGVATPIGDQGGNIARIAGLLAGLPKTTGGLQITDSAHQG